MEKMGGKGVNDALGGTLRDVLIRQKRASYSTKDEFFSARRHGRFRLRDRSG